MSTTLPRSVPVSQAALPLTRQCAGAIATASWDIAIGPLRGKVPLTPHGFKDFTCDQNQVEAWWREYPHANIGARVPKGCVVLDIDPRNGGEETFRDLCVGHVLPATFVARTGGGGWHYWFKLPHDGKVRATAGAGVDIKTHSGYVVMPESLHPETGAWYEVARFCPFERIPVLPYFLNEAVYRPLEAISPPARVSTPMMANKRAQGILRCLAGAQEGERNKMLYWASCKAKEHNFRLEEELLHTALTIGLSEAEAMSTIRSAAK